MSPNTEVILRFIGACLTCIGFIVGGIALLMLFTGKVPTWGGLMFVSVICMPFMFPIFAPLSFLMWGIDWDMFTKAYAEAKAETKPRRRR
jgi:hypothetical protein